MDKDLVVRPFLKWAGSKKQLLGEIQSHLPSFKQWGCRYFVDAFLGSGAVTFMMLNECVEKYNIHKVIANDSNKDLIGCYNSIKNNIDGLIAGLEEMTSHFREATDGEGYYRKIRAEYNDIERYDSEIERSIRFIFLNHTCFNGLYRVNSKGEFNVPYGKNKNAKIYNAELLRANSKAFNEWNVVFVNGDFDVKSSYYNRRADRTLFYFDPPYLPLNETSFSKYTKEDFGISEQKRLAACCVRLGNGGARIIQSNADTMPDFYDEQYLRFGFTKHVVQTRRFVNAQASKRGVVTEVLLTNY